MQCTKAGSVFDEVGDSVRDLRMRALDIMAWSSSLCFSMALVVGAGYRCRGAYSITVTDRAEHMRSALTTEELN